MKAQKKPVVIDYFDPTDYNGLLEWIKSFGDNPDNVLEKTDNQLFVKTLEGTSYEVTTDYIIRGVRGEYYPCKKDIFHETYDIVA